MATPFTSIDTAHTAAREGTIARNFPYELESYEVETALVPNGRAVKQGSDYDKCVLGVTAGGSTPFAITAFLGVATDNPTLEAGDSNNDSTPVGRRIDVMVKGDIWINVKTAVAVGDDVTVINATGELSSAVGTALIGTAVNGRWMTPASDGGIARLRLFGEQI